MPRPSLCCEMWGQHFLRVMEYGEWEVLLTLDEALGIA